MGGGGRVLRPWTVHSLLRIAGGSISCTDFAPENRRDYVEGISSRGEVAAGAEGDDFAPGGGELASRHGVACPGKGHKGTKTSRHKRASRAWRIKTGHHLKIGKTCLPSLTAEVVFGYNQVSYRGSGPDLNNVRSVVQGL